MPSSEVNTREIEPSVDHNHCTTRQFQHKTFCHEGVWLVFYSDSDGHEGQRHAYGGRRALHVSSQRGQLAARLVGGSPEDVDVERLEVHDEFRLSTTPR